MSVVKYKIPNLTSNELNYIIGVKIPKQNYYLRGYTTKGNIDLDSFHSDKVEITNWSTRLGSDNNPNAVLFKLGIKNYNESKINNIKIKVKEDDGTAREKPIIIININDISFGLENWITLDLTENKYYNDTTNKIEKNKAYIVQEIKYTLIGSDEEKEIKEVERDLYNYNKIIKTTTGRDKGLIRWFITTDLFNNFYSTINSIKDYCVPSTSNIRNIIEFEKILQIENLYISYSPNITLSNESIIQEEESSINFDDKCEITHNSFKPYSEYVILSQEYSSSTTHEEVNISHLLTEEEINYIYKRGLNIYGTWFYLKHVEIETQLEGSIQLFDDRSTYGMYMGGGHTENFHPRTSISAGDSLKIKLYKGAADSQQLKVYTFKDEPYNLEIRKNNIPLNYPNIITKWIKDCHELTYMEPYDIILKKLEESEEEVRVSSNKTSYKIKDINAGELEKILTLGDKSAYSLININNKDFIEFDNNKVIINLFYISDHQQNINPLKIYTFESIQDKYNKSIPSSNSGKEELYISLFPDWHGHAGDDYHYLIIHYSNNPNSSIRGYYDIPTEDYDYLDRNKYFVEDDNITTFYYTEDVITDFSNKVNKILSDNNKNYNQIYLNVEGVRLAKNYTETPSAVSQYKLRFCKDQYGYWFPSKYEWQANFDDTLKATFYLSSITDDSEGIYESYYSDNRYIQTGNSETGQLSILFRIPIRLIYVGNYNNITYSLGSLKFKLKQFNTLQVQDSKTINIGKKFDKKIKEADNSIYILKLNNEREINLNALEDKSILNNRDVIYCDNYTNVIAYNYNPTFKRVTNFYNDNFQLKYKFEEKETYSEHGYNALYSGSGDEDSATYLNFDGNFVDDRIKTN